MSATGIGFVMLDDMTGDGLVTLEIRTPAGLIVVMGEPSTDGRVMTALGVHMHGVGVGANGFGFCGSEGDRGRVPEGDGPG